MIRTASYALVALMVLAGSSARAGLLLFNDFENTTSAGGVSTSVSTSYDPRISGFVSQNSGGPAEDFGGAPFDGLIFLTRTFGENFNTPYLQFTTTSAFHIDDVSFLQVSNHNFPWTAPGYDVQLQLSTGGGPFSDVGDSIYVDIANPFGTFDIALNLELLPGAYTLRWVPRLPNGYQNTGSDFFAFDNLQFTGQAVPEPSSLTLAGLGLIGVFVGRSRWRDRRRTSEGGFAPGEK